VIPDWFSVLRQRWPTVFWCSGTSSTSANSQFVCEAECDVLGEARRDVRPDVNEI